LIRKERHDAKQQMKLHFFITPDPYIFTAEFFFESAVESFGSRPLPSWAWGAAFLVPRWLWSPGKYDRAAPIADYFRPEDDERARPTHWLQTLEKPGKTSIPKEGRTFSQSRKSAARWEFLVMPLSESALLDNCRPSWLQGPGRSLPAPESFAPSIGSPLSWVQTSRLERFPGFKSTAFVSRLKAFPNIPQNTEINSVAVCPLTMVLFPGASWVLLVLFILAKKLYHRRTLEAHPFYDLFTLLQELQINSGKN